MPCIRRQRGKSNTPMPPSRLSSFIEKISLLFNIVASCTIFILMLLIVCDVVLRRLIGVSITGSIELAEFLMVVLVFLSLAQAEVKDRNVKVSLVMDYAKPTLKRYVTLFIFLVNALFFAVLSAAAISYAASLKAAGEFSMDLQIPKYPFVYVIAAGGALLTLVFGKKFLTLLKDKKTPWTP
jgi:TRAP-type C4-dicarboxylate transport system permease small subunit